MGKNENSPAEANGHSHAFNKDEAGLRHRNDDLSHTDQAEHLRFEQLVADLAGRLVDVSTETVSVTVGI